MTPEWGAYLLAGIAPLRYVLVALAFVWALAEARARPALSLAAGTVLVQVAVAYWIVVIGMPYGIGVDAGATRLLADAVVARTSGDFGHAFVAGLPAASSWLLLLARIGVPSWALVWLSTFLPLITAPALAWVVWMLWRPRSQSRLAATLWLLFSTSALGLLKGWGFLSGLWARPGWSLIIIGWVVALLVAGRAGKRVLVAVALPIALLAPWVASPSTGFQAARSHALEALASQSLWLVLGGAGLVRRRVGVPHALVASGLAFLLIGARRSSDLWPGLTILRLGLILAATAPIAMLLRRARRLSLGGRVRGPLLRGRRLQAALVFMAASGGILLQWNPLDTNPTAAKTRQVNAVPDGLGGALRWLRNNTPVSSVILAADRDAPWIAILAGRRVWSCPSLLPARDPKPRHVVAWRLLYGRRSASSGPGGARAVLAGALLARRRGLTHVLVGPPGLPELGVAYPEALDDAPGLRLRYQDGFRVRIYEVEPRERAP